MKRLTLLLCLLALAAVASAGDKALDRDGNLYLVGPAVVNDTPVLQMQVLYVSGFKTFMTVPGSEGPESEGSPQLYLSSNARTLYIAYERRGPDGGAVVLSSYAIGGSFAEPVVLSDPRPGTFCLNPRLQQTHEIRVDDAGNKTILQFLHLLWWETGDRPEAVYCNIPILLGSLDLPFRTVIRLGELTSPEGFPSDLTGIAPPLIQSPGLYVPAGNKSIVYILFADAATLQYRLLEFRYTLDGETVNDRAHFPDIGVKNSIGLPTSLSPTQSVTTVIGTDGRVGLYSMEPTGPMVALYCDQWSTPLWLPADFSSLEVGTLIRSLVDDLP